MYESFIRRCTTPRRDGGLSFPCRAGGRVTPPPRLTRVLGQVTAHSKQNSKERKKLKLSTYSRSGQRSGQGQLLPISTILANRGITPEPIELQRHEKRIR